ncbi:hypothetical protein [Kordiimonas aestuarii]|uniref:hypothetical protein n=1 Tax=Kordiimonas aestuarii TaxID=1005925 RepID=UPI0021D048A0|nr:hypothetical protein [Kordiimonas aestuarii]
MKRNILTLAMITAVAGMDGAATAGDTNPFSTALEDGSHIQLTGDVVDINARISPSTMVTVSSRSR